MLQAPRAKTKFYGNRAFSIYAPKQWNELPENITNAKSIDIFKKLLKTFLFKNDHIKF